MSSLYEINSDIVSLIDENGEITDFDKFENLQIEKSEKIENIGIWIKDLRGDAEKIKAEKESLAEREKALKNKADRLQDLIDFSLKGENFETSKVQIKYRKSTRCIIEDEEAFKIKHPDFVKTVITEKIDLSETTKALKSGKEIDGAELQEFNNICIK